jgi:hypothetical protein
MNALRAVTGAAAGGLVEAGGGCGCDPPHPVVSTNAVTATRDRGLERWNIGGHLSRMSGTPGR